MTEHLLGISSWVVFSTFLNSPLNIHDVSCHAFYTQGLYIYVISIFCLVSPRTCWFHVSFQETNSSFTWFLCRVALVSVPLIGLDLVPACHSLFCDYLLLFFNPVLYQNKSLHFLWYFLVCFCWSSVSHSWGRPYTCCVSADDCEILLFLPRHPQCLNSSVFASGLHLLLSSS